ncbi:hypothetical protein NP233_g6886 [Leucocoprinus birnbaumii]|uniref:Cytochrome P450 n=1 Tax=Leucocoprinus birnbaumii TaxID=56174 RepID=A0AAD5YTA2_9AGAR|nr:hypothetical protein NP233_g6886 [Leucocoprinus birnbaumii]
MVFSWYSIAACLLAGLVVTLHYAQLVKSRALPLPPGPTGHWFYGVKKMLPSKEPWKAYASWSKKYNVPIISFRIYNRVVIVLNDAKSVSDLLERRANLYSDRPKQNFVGVIMKVAYGYTIDGLDDTFVNVAEETIKITDKTMANGSWLVDYYPIARYIPPFLPGGEFKRQGKQWRERLKYLSDVPHQWVKEQIASGTYTESFTSEFLTQDGAIIDHEQEDIIQWCAGGLYVGASDTTVSAVTSFILLMALYPEVQIRAQQEIDEICGQDQLPRTSQVEELDYLQAVLKEVLRFAPVGNLALPHRVIEEDIYNGYRIPKNATVIGNVWAILHDPSLYPEPDVFSPDRFINKERMQPDPRQWAFGFGRRACPGTYFAETSILLVMAGILARFKISLPTSQAPEDKGSKIPAISFTTGITSHIGLFDIRIKLRSPPSER